LAGTCQPHAVGLRPARFFRTPRASSTAIGLRFVPWCAQAAVGLSLWRPEPLSPGDNAIMRSSSIGPRVSLPILVLMLISVANSWSVALGQSALPANWQQLSPSDFATLVQGYYQQRTFQSLSPTDQASLQYQGAQLFSQVNFSSTTLTYQTLGVLAQVGESQLPQWTLAQARAGLIARHDDWTGKPYAEIFAKVMLMARLQLPDSLSVPEARRWVLAGGTADQVPQNDWVYDFVRHMFADFSVIDKSFSVSWTGQINAPQSGDYTFSLSPIDVNMGYSHKPGVGRLARLGLLKDPDIIMVGEIRDQATAVMAIQAALTGHLVFHAAYERRRDAALGPRHRALSPQQFAPGRLSPTTGAESLFEVWH
jgi:hypothetical protein